MRAAALAVAVVAAFVGVMYLRFASDSVPGPPPGAVVGGPQCVVFRNVSNGDRESGAQPTCGPVTALPTPVAVAISTSLPAPSGPPSFLSGKELIPLKAGPAIEFPENTAIIAALGCAPCGAPDQRLVRVYRDSTGGFRIDDLLSPERLGLPASANSAGATAARFQVVAMAVSPSGSELFAAVCAHANCLTIEPPPADAESAIFHSVDGGLSWQSVGTLTRVRYFAGIVRPGSLLVGSSVENGLSLKFSLFPSGEIVEPPISHRTVWPIVLQSGEILWNIEQNVVLRGDGSLYLDIGGIPAAGLGSLIRVLSRPDGGETIGLINYEGPGFANSYMFNISAGSPELAFSFDGRITADIRTEGGLIFGSTSLRAENLSGRQIPFRGLPAVIDLSNASVTPIAGPFLDEPFYKASVGIAAVQRGPFARVVNTDGTCVNVRAEPIPSAGILDCAAEGVLLRQLSDSTDFAGSTWLHVATPAGAEGWANTAYLEH